MLIYSRGPNGEYIVTEPAYGFLDSESTVVTYSKDLSTTTVNSDPTRDTYPEARKWFEKYYRPKFNQLENP